MESLYRKYRPSTFREIVGQGHIKKLLKNALEKRTLSHAYIFAGPRGTGKTTTARILAKSLNCEKNQFGEPCNECASCKSIDNGSHLDVVELDAASNRGIDEIRKIRDGVNFTPVMGKYKVYIIDEVHMLTREAFNALLKTLEEPPEHILFVLATTNPEKIPPTIISRCHVLEFRNISKEDIVQRLKEVCESEGFDVTEEALEKISKKAAGGLRDALSILEQVVRYAGGEVTSEVVEEALGYVSEDVLMRFLDALFSGDGHTVENVLDEVYIERGDFDTFLTQLVEYAVEKKDYEHIKIATKIYDIQKELKNAEEKLIVAKLLFLNLVAETRNIEKPKESRVPTLETSKSKENLIKSAKPETKEIKPSIDKLINVNEVAENIVDGDVAHGNKEEIKRSETGQEQESVSFIPAATNEISSSKMKLVTKEILDDLKLNGDLSIYVGLSLATVYELDDVVRIVFDKSKQFSYEILKEKKEQIEILYYQKSGKKREVKIELSDDDHDPVLEKLKMLLS
ncbi:MAG: DNA polymerase III subunit gamma/tau [Fervidobacterium sp.]|uniref:DNA polymerase III subunit gamma/tau n=1 Tax=Fervidobacterium gondwanense DSM 13020 TaxID=1121883 RepID=A0A1M7SB66_FERGO|nr:DNA polymerase III subunit gamma/tau [Fervidobacterium gondwanense]UXF00425.1 DNA polymerase III subunits gamma and tau [Fervidobacterium riparium]SHN55751.1 DNA polymerase-3 subunit gamma/tau [Fervidobacterium gondwanense DSM 13020]